MNDIKDIAYTFYKIGRLYTAAFLLNLREILKFYLGEVN